MESSSAESVLRQGDEFVVTLHKESQADTLGLDIRRGRLRGCISITGVKPQGLVHSWNQSHPNRLVEQGDVIVMVNECRGQKDIVKAIGMGDSLTMTIIKQGELDPDPVDVSR